MIQHINNGDNLDKKQLIKCFFFHILTFSENDKVYCNLPSHRESPKHNDASTPKFKFINVFIVGVLGLTSSMRPPLHSAAEPNHTPPLRI